MLRGFKDWAAKTPEEDPTDEELEDLEKEVEESEGEDK